MSSYKDKKTFDFISVKTLLALALVAVIVASVAVVAVQKEHQKHPRLTDTFIENQILPAGELVSAKMIYNGLVTYQNGEIPLLTKKGFSMIYRAEVQAGVDLTNAEVDIFKDEVDVYLPPVEAFTIDIDPDSLQFYDSKFALFNWENKQDVVEAIKFAEEDVRENGQLDALAALAREQTEQLLEGLLSPVIGERTLNVSFTAASNP